MISISLYILIGLLYIGSFDRALEEPKCELLHIQEKPYWSFDPLSTILVIPKHNSSFDLSTGMEFAEGWLVIMI